MGGAALAGDMHVAGRPSPSHRRCPFVLVAIALSSSHRHVILDDVNIDFVVVVVVVNLVGSKGIISPHCIHVA